MSFRQLMFLIGVSVLVIVVASTIWALLEALAAPVIFLVLIYVGLNVAGKVPGPFRK